MGEIRNVRINLVALLIEFASTIDSSRGLAALVDNKGDVVVPIERYGDFAHDMGIILGKVMEKIAEPSE